MHALGLAAQPQTVLLYPPQCPIPTSLQRDTKTAKQIAAGVKVLQKNKVPVGVVKVRPRQ